MAAGTEADIDDIGFFTPAMVPADSLTAGEVGYLITGIKDVSRLRVGDTLTTRRGGAREALPGYREVKPMVFCGLFPLDTDRYPDMRDALEKLSLNDAALFWEPETSDALGFGFRCGFLGLLHMDIVRERLEREYDLDLMATMPSVGFEVTMSDGTELEVHNPSDFPDPTKVKEIREPFVKASILAPKEYVGTIMELCQEKRGEHAGCTTCPRTACSSSTCCRSRRSCSTSSTSSSRGRRATRRWTTSSWACGARTSSSSTSARRATRSTRCPCSSTRTRRTDRADPDGEAAREDPAPAVRRADPGAVGSHIIARETVKAFRKDVTAKCYGGDISRKRKLLESRRRARSA
jgi:GTP-binding protein LepA